jgi:hypothetical protein
MNSMRNRAATAASLAALLSLAFTLLAPSACHAQALQPPVADLLGGAFPTYAQQADGRLLLFGNFDRVDTVPRRNLARLNADGSVDAQWAPEPDAIVRTVFEDAAGNLFVGGEFNRIAGRPTGRLVKLLPGPIAQIDASFVPDLPAGVTSVDAVTEDGAGGLYVAYSGASNGVLRLSASGSHDPGFVLLTNSIVLHLLRSAEGQSLFISGLFGGTNAVNGMTTPSTIAKVDADTGALDTSWTPLSGNTGAVRIRRMLLDGAGHLLLAGRFTAYPGGLVRVPVTAPATAEAFGPAFAGPTMPVLNHGIARFPDGDLLVVGTFTEAGAAPRAGGIAKLAPDGGLRAGWDPGPTVGIFLGDSVGIVDAAGVSTVWRLHGGERRSRAYQLRASDGAILPRLTQSGTVSNGRVSRFAGQPGGGRVFAAGPGLLEVDGRISSNVVALRQETLRADPTWVSRLSERATIGGAGGLGIGSLGSSLFVGGFGFSVLDSQQLPGLFRLDPADGSLLDWRPRASETTEMGTPLVPLSIASDVDAHVYVAAQSSTSMRDASNVQVGNGSLLRFSLATGIVDLNWNPAFSGTQSAGPVIALGDDGFLYYAGSRNVTASDGSVVASLARIPLAGNGRADPAWTPFAAPLLLRAMRVSGAHVYVGGDGVLKRIDRSTGLVDTGWTPGPFGAYSVRGIEFGNDGSIYVTGAFDADCIGAPTSVLRLDADGQTDRDWGVEVDGNVEAVFATIDGALLLGGDFRIVNGQPRVGIAALRPAGTSEHCSLQAVQSLAPAADAASIAAVPNASGRYIVFQSLAGNLDGEDSDAAYDVYRVDTECNDGLDSGGTACRRILRVSLDTGDAPVIGDAVAPTISADGQLIAFVAPDAAVAKVYGENAKRAEARRKNGGFGIFLRDMLTGTTSRVGSAPSLDVQPQIAPGGNAIVFPSPNAGADPGAFGQTDIYIAPITREFGVAVPGFAACVSCKSFDAAGTPTTENADGGSSNPVLSADGTTVAWQTSAQNMLPTASPCPAANNQILLRNLLLAAARFRA